MNRKKCYNSIIDCIGNTPLVKLNHVASDVPGEVFAKLEFLNPMGSSKDRIARYMIEKAKIPRAIPPWAWP
jgi:cystathionine beta-synthase